MNSKSHVVSVRFSAREYTQLTARAESLGVSLSRVLAEAWRNQVANPREQIEAVHHRLDQLGCKLDACVQFLFRVQVPPSDREYPQLRSELARVIGGVQ